MGYEEMELYIRNWKVLEIVSKKFSTRMANTNRQLTETIREKKVEGREKIKMDLGCRMGQ